MDDLLTTKEAAAMLGIKPQTLRKWRMKGKGPREVQGLPRGFGHPVKYLKVAVLAYKHKDVDGIW